MPRMSKPATKAVQAATRYPGNEKATRQPVAGQPPTPAGVTVAEAGLDTGGSLTDVFDYPTC